MLSALTILPLTLPASEFQLTRSPALNLLVIHTSTSGKAEKRGRPPSGGRPTVVSSFQSDREYRNDLVVTIDDDDLVADDEVPESPPLGMDVHDD